MNASLDRPSMIDFCRKIALSLHEKIEVEDWAHTGWHATVDHSGTWLFTLCKGNNQVDTRVIYEQDLYPEKFGELDKYIVFKRSDINESLTRRQKENLRDIVITLNDNRKYRGAQPLDGVFVKRSWPEHAMVYASLFSRLGLEVD